MEKASDEKKNLLTLILVSASLAMLFFTLVNHFIIDYVEEEIQFYRSSIGVEGPARSIMDLSQKELVQFQDQPELFLDNERTQKLASLLLAGVLNESPVYLKIRHVENFLDLDRTYGTSGAESPVWAALRKNMEDVLAQNKDNWVSELDSVSARIQEYQNSQWRAQTADTLSVVFSPEQTNTAQLNAKFKEIIENAKAYLKEISFAQQKPGVQASPFA